MDSTECPKISSYLNTFGTYQIPMVNAEYKPWTITSGKSLDDSIFGMRMGSPAPRSIQEDFERVCSQIKIEEKKMPEKQSDMRVVQIFIVDADKNIPIEKRLLYKSEIIFTESTDQELFFDINLKNIVVEHNAYRTQILDKRKSSPNERVYLEPVRISQLKMTVSVLAEF